MADPDVLTEVPAALKRLAKYVIRGFYGIEHALALDILIRNPCVKEEDMLELLKFDRKQLRSVLNNLKGDKFIKCRMRVETAADGKTTRHNYYFINYRTLVNVVKYKLDHMRRRIETDERDSTNRASFKCPVCSSTFTDLEANQLFDPMTGTFRCTFCQTEVEEDESAMPKKDARTLLARFNEQIEPIYALLRETEDVNLAYEILEPEPTEIPALKQREGTFFFFSFEGKNGMGQGRNEEQWRSKTRKNSEWLLREVVQNLKTNEVLLRLRMRKASLEGKSAKERPIWLRESTVQGAYNSEEMKEGGIDIDSFQEHEEGHAGPDDNEEVMRALLIHEKKTPSAPAGSVGAAAPVTAANGSDSESETSESDDDSPPRVATVAAHHGEEDEEDDEFEEVADDPVVMVAGRPFSYSEVSQKPELVAQMTPEEKEAYIAMGQRMFEDLFE
ncbi:General transcription factor IIE subunit 1 [Bos mutus]|uniref:General transcription factor IIE subunit 1 n=1 Tax=Bos mutus TaxID=72004 RepID=L8HL99_9CETA|nr:General transcription factor IIE subunit 1 [Bos mutus]